MGPVGSIQRGVYMGFDVNEFLKSTCGVIETPNDQNDDALRKPLNDNFKSGNLQRTNKASEKITHQVQKSNTWSFAFFATKNGIRELREYRCKASTEKEALRKFNRHIFRKEYMNTTCEWYGTIYGKMIPVNFIEVEQE